MNKLIKIHMDISIKGALEHVPKVTRSLPLYKGAKLNQVQVYEILKYGYNKGYEYLSQLSDIEIDQVLENQKPTTKNTQTKLL